MSPANRLDPVALTIGALRRNEQQWAAYESRGHCVVLAGPGSGKTKVLTAKMARILREDVRPPRGVACITFNNQCVKELQSRLGSLGVEEGRRAFVGTMHSFCLREIVIPYGRLAGLGLPDPIRVAPKAEQDRLFASAASRVVRSENPKYLRTSFDEFRRTVLDRSSQDWHQDSRQSRLVTEYERELVAAGRIDFDGIVLAALELIADNPWVRNALRAKFPALVVDEYQDLGIPLHRIVQHLCFEAGVRLFAVGDPDQSIYGFTGARPALMKELVRRADVENVRLRLNYRCGKTIIAASTTVLAARRDFASQDDNTGVVTGHECFGGFDEQVSHAIGGIIPAALARRAGRTLGDIGILYKDQYDGQVVAEAVEKAAIPYVRFDQGSPYPKTPLTAWLEDSATWCAGGWKSGRPKLSALLIGWRRFNPSLASDAEIRKTRRDLVKWLFESRKPDTPLVDWLTDMLKRGVFAAMKNDPTMADEWEALKALYRACKPGQRLVNYTLADFGGQRGSPDRLNLTTIHSAKGLEYDVVIMLGLEQGRIPYYDVTPAKEQEARRLFYVAMTRARHEVHFLWSGWYIKGHTRYSSGRSKFVDEVMTKLASDTTPAG